MTPPACPSGDTNHESSAAAPSPAALELTAGELAPLTARRWIEGPLRAASVPPRRRVDLRLLAAELAREGSLHASSGEPIRLEVGFEGPTARLSVTGPSRTPRLRARTVDALNWVHEWGVELTASGMRSVWCRVRLALD